MHALAPNSVQARQQAHQLEQVLELMRRFRVTPDDLVEAGGQDLPSKGFAPPAPGTPEGRRAEKAHRVERCWALMARLGVTHMALAPDWTPRPVALPGLKARRRRGEGVILQLTENTGEFQKSQQPISSMISMAPEIGGSKIKSAIEAAP
jgi:hypothetical protein